MKGWAIVLINLVVCLNSFSQGTIKGQVNEEHNGSLPGVTVYLKDTKFGASTNGVGKYIINDIPEGDYTLVFSCVGYKKIEKPIQVKNGSETEINVGIKESASELSEFVLTGISITGGNKGLKDLPGSAYYVSPKEMQQFSYTDINRTLRTVPGVNIQEEDGFGLRPNIGLRGTGVERNSKITVMEDGILIAPAPYSSPAAYYFPTAGRMQAIEVMKGSSQIKYGPFTTGGAINLISTQIPEELSAKVNLLAGSFGFNSLHASVGSSSKYFGYVVETFQYGADGFKELPNGDNTGFAKEDFMAKFRVNTNPTAKIYQSLTFKALQVNETSNETYLGLTRDDFSKNPNSRYAASQKDNITTKQRTFSATHLIKVNTNIDLTTTAYFTEFDRNWYKLNNLKDSTGKNVTLNDLLDNPENNKPYLYEMITGTMNSHNNAFIVRANNREYYSKGIQSALGYSFETGEWKHKMELGIRYHYDLMDRYQWDDQYKMLDGVLMQTKAGVPGTESNAISDALAIATYAQYQIKFKKLTVTPGLRFEKIKLTRKNYGKNDIDRTGVDLIPSVNEVEAYLPGVSVDYKFNQYVNVFSSVHKGFAPPGTLEGTKPEESINVEFGFMVSKNAFTTKMVGFYTNYINLLGADMQAGGGAGTIDLYNGGAAQTQGLEFMVTYDFLSKDYSKYRLPLTVAYTYTDAFFKSSFISTFGDWGTVTSGDKLPYMAPHQLAANLSFETKNYSITFGGRFMDAMRTVAGTGAIPANEKVDNYFILDMSAAYKLHKNVSMFGSVANLANQVYVVALRPSGLRPGMPQMFTAGIKASF